MPDTNQCSLLIKGGHRKDHLGTDILVENEKETFLLPRPKTIQSIFLNMVPAVFYLQQLLQNWRKAKIWRRHARNGKRYIEKFLKKQSLFIGSAFIENMEKLQYISQGNTLQEQELCIRKALDNGIKWVQVRWKNAPENELINLCEISKQLCSEYQAVCIINDHVQIAKEIDADGVHLGLNDSAIEETRLILDENKIIGGTANTLSDVIQRIKESCDYIGFRTIEIYYNQRKTKPCSGV